MMRTAELDEETRLLSFQEGQGDHNSKIDLDL
jgi:hypothetical protein